MEEKIVLATKDERALYLFRKGGRAEFVVAHTVGTVKIGDYVDGWANGHYFYTLEDAVEYFNNL